MDLLNDSYTVESYLQLFGVTAIVMCVCSHCCN
jgi:hypothetical protein